MLSEEISKIHGVVMSMLKNLSPNLTYHNVEHTMDVVRQSARIAEEEGIRDVNDLFLLNVAALYHDTGFLKTYKNHEKESCLYFLENVAGYPFTEKEKEIVVGLIIATRLPQTPKTVLEKIICDADLDYLGRKDFVAISGELKKEFLHFSIIPNEEEWHRLQLQFLQDHRYHTATSQLQREPVKQRHLSSLKKISRQGF